MANNFELRSCKFHNYQSISNVIMACNSQIRRRTRNFATLEPITLNIITLSIPRPLNLQTSESWIQKLCSSNMGFYISTHLVEQKFQPSQPNPIVLDKLALYQILICPLEILSNASQHVRIRYLKRDKLNEIEICSRSFAE